MSSNTLRGVGQHGDGKGDGKGDGESPKESDSDPGSPPESGTGPAVSGADRAPDLRTIRSLDSTVPGTRSLDSSVPDARPSLDARVPNLAATMLGMTAPNIPGRDAGRGAAASTEATGRDQGTVQGRDVHLPVEMQRRAGVISVPGASAPLPRPEATPLSVDHSEPTIAEPVRVEHGQPELNSHGPWYDQEPAGTDDYEDPKPSLIGRVAIGAAVAASLSVVLFAIVRVRAQGAAQEAEAAAAQVVAPLVQTPRSVPAPPPAEPAPGVAPEAAGAGLGSEGNAPQPEWDGPAEPKEDPTAPAATRPGREVASGPNRPTGGAHAPRPSTAAGKPAPASPLPPNLFRPKALGDGDSVSTSPGPLETPAGATAATPPAATTPPPPPSTPPAAEAPAETAPSAKSGASGDGTEAPATARPAPKARPKKDDPDSTMPLNLD